MTTTESAEVTVSDSSEVAVAVSSEEQQGLLLPAAALARPRRGKLGEEHCLLGGKIWGGKEHREL